MPETPSPHPSDGRPIDPTAPVFDATVVRIPVELDTSTLKSQIESISSGVAAAFKQAIDKAVSDAREASVSVNVVIDTNVIEAKVRDAIANGSQAQAEQGFRRVQEGADGKPGIVIDERSDDARRWPELMSKLEELLSVLNLIAENQGGDSGGP